MTSKTMLVTGGCGFIGSNFIRFLLEETPHTVINMDALTYAGNIDNLKGFVDPYEAKKRYQFHHVNICDAAAVDAVFSDNTIDMVVHFAAESHVDRSIMSGIEFVRTNVEGTQVLLDVSRKHHIEQFIHVSTDEVYGSILPPDKFTESSPLRPNSPYAASKTSADLMVMAAHKTHGFPVKITRCSNNYGPFQFPEKLMPLMISNMLDGRPLPVYGKGENVRDWIYVKDHCEGIYDVINHGAVGDVYNLGGNAEVKNIDLIYMLAEALGIKSPLIEFVKDRPGHDLRYAIDFTKATNACGWTPKTALQDGIKQTVSWYKANKLWVDNLKNRDFETYYNKQYTERD